MMRVRVYLSKYDIKDACKKRSDFYGDVEISSSDVQFISIGELMDLIRANPEYIPQLREFLEKWDEEEKEEEKKNE